MSKRFTLFFILALVIGGQLGVDLYLPALPTLARSLHTTAHLAQLTLACYMACFAIGQIGYGSLSDHYGRKLMVIIGMSIYTLGNIACWFAPNIIALLLARSIEGLGAASANTMARVMLRDNYAGQELSKNSAYFAIAWSCVPMLAPVIGGYLTHYISWRSNFALLTFVSLSLLTISLIGQREQLSTFPAFTWRTIKITYHRILTHRRFLGCSAIIMLTFATFVTTVQPLPFLLEDRLGLNSVAYGWAIVPVFIATLSGGILSSRFAMKYSRHKNSMIGFALFGTGALLSLLSSTLLPLMVTGVLIPIMILRTGTSLVYTNQNAGAMAQFTDIIGSAGAALGFLVYIGGAFTSFGIAHLPHTSPIPMSIAYLLEAGLSFFIYIKLVRHHGND